MTIKRHDYNYRPPPPDPRLAVAAAELQREIKSFVFLKECTPLLLHDVEELVTRRCKEIRNERGFSFDEFPNLAVVCLPRVGHIACLRRDAGAEQIQTTIVNLVHEFPQVGRFEIAMAVARAFPEYARRLAN